MEVGGSLSIDLPAYGITGKASIDLAQQQAYETSTINCQVHGSFPPPDEFTLPGLTEHFKSFGPKTEALGENANHLRYIAVPIGSLITKADKLAYEIQGELMTKLTFTMRKVVSLR